MTNPILNSYRRDDTSGVFVRPEIESFAYSDGEEVESRLLDIVRATEDLSSLSEELENKATDWPSRYHFSRSRANLLRPYSDLIAGDVLEIGAGCGAITRFLGECGARVTAVEGSFRRAAVAAARVRDLDNVSVVCDRIQAFPEGRKFDVVTLIGVLEYAQMFSESPSAVEDLLQLVRSLLKPNGKLVLAIENRLGLKYFAGMPEDHVNHGMYGVEGLYREREPITFGRAELDSLLTLSGFKQVEFAYPFPDYKLPQSVVFDVAAKMPVSKFNAAAFAAESAWNDPQLQLPSLFSLELAWQSIGRNGLVGELANSFLVVASVESGSTFSDPADLAWHYSTGRARRFCKATLFQRAHGGDGVVVQRFLLTAEASGSSAPAEDEIGFAPINEAYVLGDSYRTEFARILARPFWHIDEIVDYFQRYVTHVCAQYGLEAAHQQSSWNTALAPQALDVLPQNLICVEGQFKGIDEEWSAGGPVELGYVVFRALVYLLKSLTRCGYPQDFNLANFGTFCETVMERVLGGSAAENAPRYWRLEAALQQEVAGLSSTVEYPEWALGSMPILDSSAASISRMLVEIQRLRHANASWEALCTEIADRLAIPEEGKPRDAETSPILLRDAIESYISHEEDVIERQNIAIATLDRSKTDIAEALRRSVQQVEECRLEQQRLELHVADIHDTLESTETALGSAREALATMENSASWRVTRPMRHFSRMVRRLMRSGGPAQR